MTGGRTLPTYHIYGTRTTTTKNDRTIERQTDANDRTTERQNDRTAKWREAGLYLPTTFMVHGRRRQQLLIFYIYKPIGPSALSQTDSVLVYYIIIYYL
jgi:hypothetical protein